MKQKVLYILSLLFAYAWNTQAWGQTYNGGTWYSLYDTGTKTNTNAFSRDFGETTGIFAPTNKTITLEYKKYSRFSTKGTLYIYDDNNGAYEKIGEQTDIKDYENWKTYSGQCNENISKIRLRMENGDGISVKNIKIPLAKHILLNDGSTYGTTSMNVGEQFEATPMGTQCAKTYTINLRSFLTNGDITITSDNSAFHFGSGNTTKTFNVGANACASANGNGNCGTGTLGKIDNYAITVYFTPSISGTNSGTITISDGTSPATVTISGQGKPVFNFTATTGVNITEGGSATATVTNSSITGNVGQADASTTATFTATANSGYEFVGWGTSANATSFVSIENPYQPTVTNNKPGSTQDITLYAIFKPVFKFSATAQSSDTSAGTASATITEKVLGETPTSTSASTTATFTATPKENCTFGGWYESSDCSGTPISTNTTYSTTVENTQIGSTKNITLYAKFKKNQSLSWSDPNLDLNLVIGTTSNSSATATSGLDVTYTSSDTDHITVDADGTLHAVGQGRSSITAIQEGNNKFNPATSISREFSVGDKKQATFTPAWEGTSTDIKVGTKTSIGLTNIATDNTFTITSSTSGIISWKRSGNTLTISALKAGTTTLTLSQEGSTILNGNQTSYEITVSRYPNSFAVESESKSLNVGDTWTGVVTNTGNGNTQVSYSVDGIATYDASTNTITAVGQGATTITLSQAATEDHEAATKNIIVNVAKVTNTLDVTLPTDETNVEGTINLTINNKNNDAGITANITEQVLSSSVNNGTNVITYENGVITAHNAGTAKIQFTQAETTKYTGYTSNIYTITVSKIANPINVTLDGDQRNSKNIARNTTVALAYSSPSNAAYSVTLRDGSSNVTTLNGANLTSGSVDGTDIWDITQPETYKYVAGTSYVRLKVNSVEEAEGYVLNDATEYSHGTGSGVVHTYTLSGPGETLTYSARRQAGAIYYNLYVEYSTDGSNWKEAQNNTNVETGYSSFPCAIPEDAKFVRFRFPAGGTLTKYIKDVKVTRKTYVRPSVDKTDLGNVYTDKTATATISVDYSSTNGGNISIESNNPRFTVNPANINVANNSDNVGNPSKITLTYTPDPEHLGEEEATITVSDLFYSEDIKVKATAQKYPTTISKKYEDATASSLKVDGTITDAFAFTGTSSTAPGADSNNDFYYTISHTVNGVTTGSAHPTQVISYDPATNTIKALNAGTASLTIYQKKTNLYHATSQTFNFTVSKLDNNAGITLSQTTLDVDGTATVNLTNKVSDGVLAATFENISYTNESQNREGGLLSLTENTLTAVNAGTAKVTITQAETYKYSAASATFDVSVNKLAQTLTWDNPDLETSLQKDNTLKGNTATSDAGLTPVTYASSNTASIHVDANTGVLRAIEAGSNITITASQAGNYKYAPATLTRQFSVFNKQTPTFTTDANFTGTNGRIALEGTATITVTGVSDDEDFTITNTNSNVINVSRNGETITIEGLAVGTAKLTLSQKANEDYLAKTQEYTIEVYLPDDYLMLSPDTEPNYTKRNYSKVKLNRTLKQGYNTLALPFDTDVATLTGRESNDDWVAQLALVTKNGQDGYTLYFTKVEDGTITANQPYILYLGTAVVNPSWTNMTVVAAESKSFSTEKNKGWTMKSNYEPKFSMSGKYGIVNNDGNIQKGASGSTLNAFSAYLEGPANSQVKAAFLDDATAIEEILQQADEDTVIKRIENGKLVILQGDKKYNASGVRLK